MLGVSFTLRSSVFLAGAIIIGAYVIFGGPGDKNRKKRRKDTIPGLANVGNSCFLNALVQSLASCPIFTGWLSSRLRDPLPPLVSALNDLLKVLNNEGGHGGDACAGEVMRALRGHGWVISMEEQDTHELFHALMATLDEELSNALTTPSLLDISSVEGEETNIYEDGVLIRVRSVECLNVAPTIKKQKEKEINGEASISPNVFDKKYTKNTNKLDSVSSADRTVASQGCDNQSMEINSSVGNGANIIVNGLGVHKFTDGCDKDCNSQKKINDADGSEKVYTNGKVHICNGKSCCAEDSSETTSSGVKISDYYLLESRSESDNILNERMTSKASDRKAASILTIKRNDDAEKVAVERYWKNHPSQQDSPFRGYLASQLQCILCGHKNPAQWSSFESISLSLPSVPWGEVTLQELLDAYITQEKVTDVNCDNCTKKAGCTIKTSFTKQLTIGKLPECLCFHVKRTIWLENGTAIKRRDHVMFSEFLTMDPYTYTTSIASASQEGQESSLQSNSDINHHTAERNGGSTLPKDWAGNLYDHEPLSILSKHATSSQIEPSSFVHVTRVRCEQLYRLKAVIVHVGDIFYGHFVTYRKGALGTRTRNRWFYTSDLLVREASLDEVKKANVYMILYEKVTQ